MTRFTLAAALFASVAAATVASAATTVPFDQAQFAAAQAAGKPTLVEVHAWWCPICASQSGTLKALSSRPDTADLTIFRINYDKQKEALKQFGVQRQGTIIGFKGKEQTGRIDFKTDKAVITALVDATVK
ncbi:hypothetical protein IP88_14620 [alpha proteobacterium AAP81b]|nr:hypothetical protein IP88_14620 [alpha proteobacterium AAP81b]